jgi:hypothetical protein
MLRRAVRDSNQALAYMVDCTLATVAHMATKKAVQKLNSNGKSALRSPALIGCATSAESLGSGLAFCPHRSSKAKGKT